MLILPLASTHSSLPLVTGENVQSLLSLSHGVHQMLKWQYACHLLVMRLFKPLEHFQAALRAAVSVDYPIEQFTTIGRQLGYFGYLSLDMIVWVWLLNIPLVPSSEYWTDELFLSFLTSVTAQRHKVPPIDARNGQES